MLGCGLADGGTNASCEVAGVESDGDCGSVVVDFDTDGSSVDEAFWLADLLELVSEIVVDVGKVIGMVYCVCDAALSCPVWDAEFESVVDVAANRIILVGRSECVLAMSDSDNRGCLAMNVN